MDTIYQLVADIMADEQNITYTKKGIKPLFTVPSTARINIVGQAPGIRAQESGLYWNDPSGDNLRKWLGVDREMFYHSGLFEVVPMDYYLQQKSSDRLTEKVKHYKDYLPTFFQLVHPSPHNNIWQAKNPWFEEYVIPDLQAHVKEILSK